MLKARMKVGLSLILLKRDMSEAADNAPLFIEAFSDALEGLRNVVQIGSFLMRI